MNTTQKHDVNQLCARHSLHEVHIDKFDQLDDMLVASLKARYRREVITGVPSVDLPPYCPVVHACA